MSTLQRYFFAFMFASANIFATDASAGTFTINFESYADGDTPQSEFGLTMTGAMIASAGNSLNEFEVPPVSGINVALNQLLKIRVDFSSGASNISGYLTYSEHINVAIYGNVGLLKNYDSLYSSNLALSGDPGSLPSEFFSLTSPLVIKYLEITASSPFSFALDDLSWTQAQENPPTIPEPNQTTLFFLGLLAILRSTHRARRFAASLTLVLPAIALAQGAIQAPSIYPATIKSSIPQTITSTIFIDDPRLIIGSVQLIEIDANGRQLRKLGSFADDGIGGDEIAGDKMLTARVTLNDSIPRPILIAASMAFKGELKRTVSAAATLWISADVPPPHPLIVIQQRSILFKDAGGNTVSTRAILNNTVTSVSTPEGPGTQTTSEFVFGCELQTYIGVITNSILNLAQYDEGTSNASDFKYYDAAGQLKFQRQTLPGQRYFIDPELQFSSRDGTRLILIETSEQDTEPNILYMNNDGTVLANYSLSPDIQSLKSAQLTSNGKFIGLLGMKGSAGNQSIEIIVIDTSTNAIIKRSFSPAIDPYVELSENTNGSFLVVANNVEEQLP